MDANNEQKSESNDILHYLDRISELLNTQLDLALQYENGIHEIKSLFNLNEKKLSELHKICDTPYNVRTIEDYIKN
jgi:hypothetical protein